MLARVIDLEAYRRDGVLRDLSREVPVRVREVIHAAADATLLAGGAVPAEVEAARIATVAVVAVGAVARRVHMSGEVADVRCLTGVGLALCGAVRESASNVTALVHRVTCERCARALLAIHERRKASGGATWEPEVVAKLARKVARARVRRCERARGGR